MVALVEAALYRTRCQYTIEHCKNTTHLEFGLSSSISATSVSYTKHGYSYYCFQNLTTYHSSNFFISKSCIILILPVCTWAIIRYIIWWPLKILLTKWPSWWFLASKISVSIIVYWCINTIMHVHSVILTSCSTGAVRIFQSLLVDSWSWGYMGLLQIKSTEL